MSRNLTHDEILGKPVRRLTLADCLVLYLTDMQRNPLPGIYMASQTLQQIKKIHAQNQEPKK